MGEETNPTERGAWLAFIRYGVVGTTIFCAFVYFREGWQEGGDCSSIVKFLWGWNLAKVLGDKAWCPYIPDDYETQLIITTALFFILWPPIVFMAVSFALMRIDAAGGFKVIAKVKSLYK